jgi:hypothetical protein
VVGRREYQNVMRNRQDVSYERAISMKDLKDKCIQLAIEYGIAAYEVIENPRKTNRLFDKNRTYFQQLKSTSNGHIELFTLLDHEHPYVRYSAAIYLLSINEIKAKVTIEKLKGYSKQLDFSIKYLLQEWNNGNLREYYK